MLFVLALVAVVITVVCVLIGKATGYYDKPHPNDYADTIEKVDDWHPIRDRDKYPKDGWYG